MKKSPKAPKMASAKRSFYDRHPRVMPGLVLLLVALVTITALWVHTYTLQRQEKAQFAQAQVDLNGFYKEIVQKMGTPSKHQASQNCSYTSEEIAKGSLSCDVDQYLLFSFDTEDGYTQNIALLSRALENSSIFMFSKNNNYKELGDGYELLFIKDFSYVRPMNCSAQVYRVSSQTPQREHWEINKPYNVFVDLNCNRGASSEIFPLVNKR